MNLVGRKDPLETGEHENKKNSGFLKHQEKFKISPNLLMLNILLIQRIKL